MKTLAILLYLCATTISEGFSAINPPSCEYLNKERSYHCKFITDTFPRLFYGNYNLRCDNCNIKIFTPQTFPHENSLTAVNVSNSGIELITSGAFSALSNTQYIFLDHNKITNISRGAFSGLRQVFQLRLEYNRISHLNPGFVNDLEVNSIRLSHNFIEELPENTFEGALTVITLNLDNNEIKTIHKDALAGFDSLEYLELHHNRLCHLPVGLFKDLRNLRVLNLADNKLSKFSLGTFSGLRELQGLILANNSIKVFDGTDLLPLLHLIKLDLSGNEIYYLDPNGIFSNAPSIRYLHMEDNIFSCQLLINILQYFKSKGVEIVTNRGRYYLQNVNGIACIESAVMDSIPFDYFLNKVTEESKMKTDTC